MFDENKVASVMNLRNVKEGDVGWVSDNPKALKQKVEGESPLVTLAVVTKDGTKGDPFKVTRDSLFSWVLFYPAPYSYKQELWVEEHGVEVGTTVRIKDVWNKEDQGYQFDMAKNRLGWLGEVYEIHDDTLIVYFYDRLPYEDPEYPSGIIKTFEKVPFFVLDIIGKPISTPAGITPFKNKEEFFPHKDRWFEDAESTEFARVTHFNDEGVVLGSGEEADFVYYSELLSKGYKLVDGDIREYPGLDSKGNLKCLI